MKSLISILSLLLITNVYSSNWHPHSNKGIQITPEKENDDKVSYKAGDTALKKGAICAISWGHLLNTKEQCRRILGNLQIKAFFPDATTEVTENLQISPSANKKELNYSYTTPPLVADGENVLKIVVGPTKGKIEKLLRIQAKFEKRILFIQKRIDYHKNKNSHANWTKALEHLRNRLKKYSENITKLIEENVKF